MTVWYKEAIIGWWLPIMNVSDDYSCWGRGRLHVLMAAGGLTGTQEMPVKVMASLWNDAHTERINIEVAKYTLAETYPRAGNRASKR